MKTTETIETKTASKAIANKGVEFKTRFPVVDTIQTKLTIGLPGDKYEQEADWMADQVMSMPESKTIQPECDGCEEVENLQMKPLLNSITPWVQTQFNEEEEEEPIQTKPKFQPSVENDSGWIQASLNSSNGMGGTLPDNTRSFMENRFGVDFSRVRIHNHSNAFTLNQKLNSQAFTTNSNIYFNRGKYNPESESGKRLLAHELTHVVQQGNSIKAIQRFVSCEAPSACPRRDRGEMGRSGTSPHLAEIYDPTSFGILISNFAIDDHSVKSDLASNSVWTTFTTSFASLANDAWEIRGYSDCLGDPTRNTGLRTSRAAEIATMLPTPAASGRVRMIRPAPLTQCIESNTSESGRKKNRSVLIRRMGGSTGPTPPTGARPIGPVRPPGSPFFYCRPYVGPLAGLEAARDRLMLTTVWLTFANSMFGTEVHDMWRDYLNRPKGASLTPRVFRGAGNVIVDAFRTDSATTTHKTALYTTIRAAAARSPEATVPFSGTNYLSPRIPLGTVVPAGNLNRNIAYTNGHRLIPGNIAGGASPTGAPSSDAGPDLRLFTGTVQIARRKGTGSTETKRAIIDLQLQVIDAIDFCPGNPGGFMARNITVPMSRLEATPTERTYDLPFHVFINWSETVNLP